MYARGNEPVDRAVARTVGSGDSGRRLRSAILVALLCGLALVRPSVARAGWPLLSPAKVMLGFGAVYADGGDSSRHRGVDLQGSAGERVVAPLSGRVSFAGSVPGVGGRRVVAVTIETSRGKITLLPLDDAAVTRGAQVAEGDSIGVLAATGDGSTSGVHLHVGAREGDLYVDPLGLMALPPPATAQGEGDAAGAPDGAAVAAGAPRGAGSNAGVSVAPSTLARAAKVDAVGRTVATGELAPGVCIAVRGAATGGAGAGEAISAAAGAAGSTAGARSSISGAPQATVLTADGVVVAAGNAATPQEVVGPAWISGLVTKTRAFVVKSLRVASFALLGVMAALGALWPLWRRSGRKGRGKVLVSAAREDVAAAPGR